jgi:hypothetical protein
MAAKQRVKKNMIAGSATARSSDGIWKEIEEPLRDPGMIDEGDLVPSEQAANSLKCLIETTEGLLSEPIPNPHIEFLEGSIRLIWSRPDKNIRLVIASRDDRRSYLYHEEVRNGLGRNEGMDEPTAENLARWLTVIQSQSRDAHAHS